MPYLMYVLIKVKNYIYNENLFCKKTVTIFQQK